MRSSRRAFLLPPAFRRNGEGTVLTGVCPLGEGGTPPPIPTGGTSARSNWGTPQSGLTGLPPLGLDGVTPCQEWMGVPTPPLLGQDAGQNGGDPPHTHTHTPRETEQQSGYFLVVIVIINEFHSMWIHIEFCEYGIYAWFKSIESWNRTQPSQSLPPWI